MSFTEYLSESTTKMKKEYDQLLKNHDWSYQYSNDRRAYKKGQESWEKILELKNIVDKDSKIFNKYAPKGKFDKKDQSFKIDNKTPKPESKEQLAKKAKTQQKITNDINDLMMSIKKEQDY